MHKKEKTDAQRASVFTKIGKEISIAVREGGPDPVSNTRLRDLIQKAKANNVPNDNIERVIKKAAGGDGAQYEVVVYEGYGIGGVAVIVETTTDNRNRTAADIRHSFDKCGGNMGTTGCVSFMFADKGVIVVDGKTVADEDRFMEDVMECGAVDFTGDDGIFEVFTDPSELPAAIIKRLPVRFNYDNRYFKDTWEGLPTDGYTKWMERMIDDPRITVELGVDFFDESQPYNKTALKAAGVPVVYTGPVDRYFDYELGDLKWRTVDFKEVRYDEGDHFGCPVMNFSDADVPYTRAIEFKNFNPERHDSQNPNKTVVWEEYSRFAERGDEPYYPVNTDADKALYAQYEAKAKAEPNTVFGGRLGTYKYYDMHQVIDTALTAYEEQVAPLLKK